MKGFLDKKQPKAFIFGKWKSRYWVLKRDKFKYYSTQESENHLGVIDFNKVEASVFYVPDSDVSFKITVNGTDKEFVFKAKNSKEWENWINSIDESIRNSKGKHLSLKISDPKFWKNEYINVSELETYADNWDLLLFRSKKYSTKFQRALTRSQYDHVGMVVLCETDDNANTIYLLEAVWGEGVRLVEFLPNIQAYYDVYSKISYRPLQNWERTEKMLNDLDSYLEEVLGRSYGISLKKFFRKSVNLKGTGGEDIWDVKRTFQWAELVAKMYKVLGILPVSEHSAKYVPGSWTSKRAVTLKKGTLGPEWTLNINE